MDLLIQLTLNGLFNGAHFALLAMGFALIFGTTGVVHFAYGPVYAVGAYVVWALVALAGLPFWVAVGLGVAATAALGVASYLFIYRPFEIGGSPPFVVLVASLGLFIVIKNLIGIVFGTDVKTVDVAYDVHFVGNAFFTTVQVGQVLAALLVGGGIALFLRTSRYGKAIRAMADNREMATVIGIDTTRLSILVFALGSAVSAVAGALVLLRDGLNPNMGFGAVFVAFVAVIVGGVGSLRGAVVAGFLLAFVQSLGMWQIPTEWQNTIVFVVLFGFLLARPSGIVRRA
ncbi:branched-chain amino acid ABC transporter permease [Azospirillum palustre]|uniref:Branched-chain amino acid ABC transporter permease n=1 Tax=Azospirillum palustre TaxID=2044885 RepID=A0A2B8BJ26_9PROT|nr:MULTISPECIES: branched-chain amino acid ABC transporter permease [Azospirillum]MDR6775406.1 branched-chain amino acid transport system permease protein [Azospirillum sp. BE72]PGH57227.1 branched-chain amino acid ABC transporter permease [Azospirillum palustre]